MEAEAEPEEGQAMSRKGTGEDLSGRRFGRWLVGARAGDRRYGRNTYATYHCVCDCGAHAVVWAQALRAGTSKGCGCVCLEKNPHTRTHGETRTYLYRVWCHMRERCYKPSNVRFNAYGARGITVFDEWRTSYEAFSRWIRANIGERPTPEHSLDRIDNDGHYEPSNLRWATNKEQVRNSRKSRLSSDDVAAIRAARAEGVSHGVLAARFGVTKASIKDIHSGRTWR